MLHDFLLISLEQFLLQNVIMEFLFCQDPQELSNPIAYSRYTLMFLCLSSLLSIYFTSPSNYPLTYKILKTPQSPFFQIHYPALYGNIQINRDQVFIIEVMMNFNTAYYQEGVIHENRKQIIRHYLNSEFIWDIIVVIPYQIHFYLSSRFLISRFRIDYIDFVLLLRVKSVKRIIENVEESTSIRERFAAFIDLCKLISLLIFTNHICACIWHYIGRQQLNYSNSPDIWLIRYNMVHSSWISRYIYCFYWSTITTLTVGYGDIVPGNDIERFFCTIIILICSIVFGYTLTSIGSIFTQMKEKNDKYKNNMAQINSYIKQHKLNKYLQIKVRKYFEYYFKQQDESNEECQQLMQKLTPDLKKEVNRDIFKKILQGSKIISETFSEAFINELCEFMKLKHFLPGDIIFTQDVVLDQLLFLTKGEMQIFLERQLDMKNTSKTQLRTYSKGYVIGTKNFLQNRPMEYSSKALKFVEIAYLQYNDFIRVLKGYAEDYEKFAILRDNLIFNRKFNKVVDVCAICSSNHQLLKCPFSFFQVNRYKLICEKRQRIENPRQQVIRKLKKKKKNFYVNRNDIQINAVQLCFENGIIEEDDLTSDYEKKLGLLQFKSQQDFFKGETIKSDDSHESIEEKIPRAQVITYRIANSTKDINKDITADFKGLPAKKLIRNQERAKNTHVSFQQPDDQDCFSYRRKKSQFYSANSLHNEELIKAKESSLQFCILDAIQQDYQEFIKEDLVPEIDRYFNFTHYFQYYNSIYVLSYLKEITDENFQILMNTQKKKYKKNNNLKILLGKKMGKQRSSMQLSNAG